MDSKNVLFLCLDSVRFDTFINAETPNMNKVGQIQKAHSFSCWTLPSIIGYLMNVPPIGLGKTLYEDQPKYTWVPMSFKDRGYITAWLSPNGTIFAFDKASDGWFQKGFDFFKGLEYKTKHRSTRSIIEDLKRLGPLFGLDQPKFVALLLEDTHYPYSFDDKVWTFDKAKPEENFKNQVKAIEYVDRVFPELMKSIKGATEVIITSDHGELFGPEYYSHNPSTVRFDPKLFEIPFIRGEMK